MMSSTGTDRERSLLLSLHVFDLARTQLMLEYPFLSPALAALQPQAHDSWLLACDGQCVFYDPLFILQHTRQNPDYLIHALLHILLHCLFQHFAVGPGMNREYWDLACDLCVEEQIAQLYGQSLPDPSNLKQRISPFTAERIYHALILDAPTPADVRSWQRYHLDDHRIWYMSGSGDSAAQAGRQQKTGPALETLPESGVPTSAENTLSLWRSLQEQIQNSLLSGSCQQGDKGGGLLQLLSPQNRPLLDLADFLRRFAVRSEVLRASPDEFDYIYYTYGLSLYGNTPLIEPLEYREDRKIRDFVIVLDTSGSVAGDKIRRFLEYTWSVLKAPEVFADDFRLHLLQCDTEVRRDDLITSQQEFDHYLSSVSLRGFGGTDFRPAFAYVTELQRRHSIRNLRGLIYFTDGLGTYPAAPPFLTAFLFVDPQSTPNVPDWAISAVLSQDGIHIIGG